MKVVSANGVHGHLLWSLDEYVFRVYDNDGGFKDYSLKHCDLTVTIDDFDASFYEYDDGNLTLDHSPVTLNGN